MSTSSSSKPHPHLPANKPKSFFQNRINTRTWSTYCSRRERTPPTLRSGDHLLNHQGSPRSSSSATRMKAHLVMEGHLHPHLKLPQALNTDFKLGLIELMLLVFPVTILLHPLFGFFTLLTVFHNSMKQLYELSEFRLSKGQIALPTENVFHFKRFC